MDDILKLIQNLYSEKARDHDRISIQMLKICEPSIRKLLETIFKSCLESEIFLLEWKKKNMLFQFIKKWQTITSKLQADITIYRKNTVFERLLYNEMFDFLF